MSNQEEVKNLTVEHLEDLESLNNVEHEVLINNISIKIIKFFKKTEIQKLIKEVIKNMHENKMSADQIEEFIIPYINVLMIKYFTSLKMNDNMDDQLRVMEILINNDLFQPILSEFPEDEILKIYDEFKETLVKINKLTDEVNNDIDNLTIENKEEILNLIGRK